MGYIIVVLFFWLSLTQKLMQPPEDDGVSFNDLRRLPHSHPKRCEERRDERPGLVYHLFAFFLVTFHFPKPFVYHLLH